MARPPLITHVSGYGSCVYARGLSAYFATSDAAWSDDRSHAELVSHLSRQRLGHGFIEAFTDLGKNEQARGWWKIEMWRRLRMDAGALGSTRDDIERHDAIDAVSRFTRTGWCEFITERACARFGRPIALSFRSIKDLFDAIWGLSSDLVLAPIQSVSKLLMCFFRCMVLPGSNAVDAAHLNTWMKCLHGINKAVHTDLQSKGYEDIGAWIGRLMLHKIETITSTVNVPQAIILALQDHDGVYGMPVDQMQRAWERDPLKNPDTRLAMLCMLRDTNISSPEELARAARNPWRML